jgi:NAD(P)-dependent dehydrogenase (short-subunit alcohol dehydrogenase family)
LGLVALRLHMTRKRTAKVASATDTGTHFSTPDRGGVRRHAALGDAPRRPAGRASRALRASPPIGRVVGPADIAALAVHLMTNTAVTGATFDIDGCQQLVEG